MPAGRNIQADVEVVKRTADIQAGRCICEPHSPLITPGCRARTHTLTDAAQVRSPRVGTGQSPIVAEAALKCADCPHPGDQPCNTRATECGAALRSVPTEAELLAQRPPNFVSANMDAIQRDLDFVTGDDDNETAPGDVIIGKRGGLRMTTDEASEGIHPAWFDPEHPDAPRYVHAEIGEVGPLEEALRAAEAVGGLTTGHYAAKVAQEAIELFTGPRNADYGDATDNFQDIADLWSVVLRPILTPGAAITAEQVAIMSALIKVARLNTTPDHDDSWTDGVAYLALGAGINRRRVADVGVDTRDAP